MSDSDSQPENYCESHDVNIDRLPDRDFCPYCRMEQDRQAEMMERATRHAPRSYDDPASIDSYRR